MCSGREIGPFSAIEESTLAYLTPPEKRSDVFAWYVLTGSAGGALGKFLTGLMVSGFLGWGWTEVGAYRSVFVGYAVVGVLQLAVVGCLSREVELYPDSEIVNEEEEALLESSNVEDVATQGESLEAEVGKKTLFPRISQESRVIVFKLCILFALDSLGSGLVPS